MSSLSVDPVSESLKKSLSTLEPLFLDIQNQSHKHANHTSSPKTNHSHYHIRIKSKYLVALSRIQQHRLIYTTIHKEWSQGIHAISIEIL